jgi:hypothetical protein
MSKKQIIITAICLVGLATSALTFKSFGRQTQSAANTLPQVSAAPEYALYRSFFHQIDFLKRKADELDQKGKDGSGARTLIKRQTGLSDAQMQAVEEIVADCQKEVTQQDAKAMAVGQAYRERLQNSPTPNGYLPAPPPELQAMQQERNAILLRARDRIRATLSEQDFARLDAFVKQHGAPAKDKIDVSQRTEVTNR